MSDPHGTIGIYRKGGSMSFLENENQMVIDATYSEIGDMLVEDWVNANLAYSNYIKLEKILDNSNVKSKLNVIRSVSEMYESDLKIRESKEKLEIEKLNYQLTIDEKNTSIIIIVVSSVSFFVFFILFLSSFRVPAYLFLGIWMIQQTLAGLGSLSATTLDTSGVAYWAHIGGFVYGILAGFFFYREANAMRD